MAVPRRCATRALVAGRSAGQHGGSRTCDDSLIRSAGIAGLIASPGGCAHRHAPASLDGSVPRSRPGADSGPRRPRRRPARISWPTSTSAAGRCTSSASARSTPAGRPSSSIGPRRRRRAVERRHPRARRDRSAPAPTTAPAPGPERRRRRHARRSDQVGDLRALLTRREVEPPYVLVGYSSAAGTSWSTPTCTRPDVVGAVMVDVRPPAASQQLARGAAAAARRPNPRRSRWHREESTTFEADPTLNPEGLRLGDSAAEAIATERLRRQAARSCWPPRTRR